MRIYETQSMNSGDNPTSLKIRSVVKIFACAFFVVFWVVVYLGINPGVLADEAHVRLYHADAQQDNWMRSLIRPDTGTSCCNLNDCNPTDAEWHNGQWWAVYQGTWRAIPPEKVLSKPLSMDGEAWLCAMERTVFCFVPPLTSY